MAYLRPVDIERQVAVLGFEDFDNYRLPPPQTCTSSNNEEANNFSETKPLFRFDNEDEEENRFESSPKTMKSTESMSDVQATTLSSDHLMIQTTSQRSSKSGLKSGRECPSPPHSSDMSFRYDNEEQQYPCNTFYTSLTEQLRSSIEDAKVDDDHALFEATVQALSSPFYQNHDFLLDALTSTCPNEKGGDDDEDEDDELDSPTPIGKYIKPNQEEILGQLSTSSSFNSGISFDSCVMCDSAPEDCDDNCVGRDLRELLKQTDYYKNKVEDELPSYLQNQNLEDQSMHDEYVQKSHPCDLSGHSSEMISSSSGSIGVLDLQYPSVSSNGSMPMELDEFSKGYNIPIPQKRNTDQLFNIDESEDEEDEVDTYSIPSTNSWKEIMTKCKNGTMGSKHWCRQLNQFWYDLCHDVDCDTCMEAFFVSKEDIRAKESSQITDKDVAKDKKKIDNKDQIMNEKKVKRNSFTLKLMEGAKKTTNAKQNLNASRVLKSKENNTVDSVVDHKAINSKANPTKTSRIPQLTEKTTRKENQQISHAQQFTTNSRKGIILQKQSNPSYASSTEFKPRIPSPKKASIKHVRRRSSPRIKSGYVSPSSIYKQSSPARKARGSPRPFENKKTGKRIPLRRSPRLSPKMQTNRSVNKIKATNAKKSIR